MKHQLVFGTLQLGLFAALLPGVAALLPGARPVSLLPGVTALRGPRSPRSSRLVGGLFDAIAQDPLGMLKNNLQQMSDQRVAQISHVMLRTDPAALAQRTKGECFELLSTWKEVIGDDPERFALCASERSECASKSRGGALGYNSRAQMSKQFNDIAFVEEAGRVYGPIETKDGLHLIYLHSCRGGDDFKKDVESQ